MQRSTVRTAVATRAVGLALGIALVMASSGCGLFGSDSDAGFVETMLGQVPDTKSNRAQITMSDVAAARKLAGIAQPPHDASEGKVGGKGGYIMRLFIGQVGKKPAKVLALPTSLFSDATSIEGQRRELGFSLVDADQTMQAGFPPNQIEIVRGEQISGDDIDHAVHADRAWKDALQIRTHAGERYYRWLPDGQIDPKRRSRARQFGESRRLAVDGHQVRWARRDKVVEESIDAGHNKVNSLADDETMRSVARALDDHHAYNAYLTGDPGQFSMGRAIRTGTDPDIIRRQQAQLAKQALRPWRALAVGDAVQDDKPVGLIVIANADGDAAKANVAQLRQALEKGSSVATNRPYRNLLKIKSIKTQGSLVVAVVSVELPTQLIRLVLQREPLFNHS